MQNETTARSGVFGDGCAHCGKPIYNGLYCSVTCARAEREKREETARFLEILHRKEGLHGES